MVLCIRSLVSPLSRTVAINFTSVRQMTAAVKTDSVKSLSYKEYGEPVDVLHVITEAINQPANNQVLNFIQHLTSYISLRPTA